MTLKRAVYHSSIPLQNFLKFWSFVAKVGTLRNQQQQGCERAIQGERSIEELLQRRRQTLRSVCLEATDQGLEKRSWQAQQ